jgi:hypothetical protein
VCALSSSAPAAAREHGRARILDDIHRLAQGLAQSFAQRRVVPRQVGRRGDPPRVRVDMTWLGDADGGERGPATDPCLVDAGIR